MAKAEEKNKVPGQIILDNDMLGDDAIETGGEIGPVQIHNSVIAAIARLTALNVPGVAELNSGFVEDIATAIGTMKSEEKGIRVEIKDDGVIIEMNLVMEYGVRIPHVAWQVQNEVRRAVEQMTSKTVRSVKVIVQGVKMPAGIKNNKQEQHAS